MFRSVPNPIPTCQYSAWRQISPSGRATLGLSWVITTEPVTSGGVIPDPIPGDIIQFLTGQINYEIEWTITNNSNLNTDPRTCSPREVSNSRSDRDVVFLLPDLGLGQAFEPPDICGNKIKFILPKRIGGVTRGKFTVPGQYVSFVISAPRDIDMELRVTGFLPKSRDPYAVYPPSPTNFYVRVNGCKVLAYQNALTDPSIGQVTRTVSPEFATLERIVIERFRSCPFLSCVIRPPTTLSLSNERLANLSPNTIVALASHYYNEDGSRNKSNCMGFNTCGYVVAKLFVSTVIPGDPPLASKVGDDNPLFLLPPVGLFKISFKLEGSSPSPADAFDCSGTDLGPYFSLCSGLFNFTLVIYSPTSGIQSVVEYEDRSHPVDTGTRQVKIPIIATDIKNANCFSKIPLSIREGDFYYLVRPPFGFGPVAYYIAVNGALWTVAGQVICGGDFFITFNVQQVS